MITELPDSQVASIYIWHHSSDNDFSLKLEHDLLNSGFDVYKGSQDTIKDMSFQAVEWRLTKLDFVIFILSKNSVNKLILAEDIKKILRQKEIVVVPAIIDDQGARNIPILLKFIKPLDFRTNYNKTLSLLVDGIRNQPESTYDFYKSTLSIFKKPFVRLSNHYRRYMLLSPLTFCWQITVENLIVSLTVTGIILFFFQPSTRTNLETLSPTQFFWLVIIIGPILETVILQAFPVFLAKMIGFKFLGQVFFSIIPFAILHFSRSIGTGIGAGIIGGFYSAFTYVHWRGKSLWTAVWVTALSHVLYNFAIFAMLIGEF